MNAEQRTVFIHKAGPYQIQHGMLFKLLLDERQCRFLEVTKVERVIAAKHTKDVGVHYATKNTVAKIMNAGYWWPTMFKDVHDYIHWCEYYQRTERRTPTTRWPLVPIMPLAPFKKWRIDFVEPIQRATKHTQRRYILVVMDYATEMIEAKATRREDAATVSKFLSEFIITRYGCPLELVSD